MADALRAGANRKRAVETAADQLRDAILRGTYPPGTDLPGERELATQLGVARLTLRAALARLEAEGLVRPVHGSGNRVLDYRETGGVELVGHLVALGARGGAETLALLDNILELRRALAVEAMGLAAERVTPEELARLRAHVALQATALDDPPRYIQGDLVFARMIAQATHNVAIVLAANTVTRILESQPGAELTFMANPAATLAFYTRVLAMIEARDARRTRRFAQRVIALLDRGVLARIAALVG